MRARVAKTSLRLATLHLGSAVSKRAALGLAAAWSMWREGVALCFAEDCSTQAVSGAMGVAQSALVARKEAHTTTWSTLRIELAGREVHGEVQRRARGLRKVPEPRSDLGRGLVRRPRAGPPVPAYP